MTTCLLSRTMQTFHNGVYSYREEFVPKGANSFLKELTPIEMGGTKENKICFP